ncbi:MAG: transglutaminase domain-containing protein [Polyangiaceae bacterium]|nr:transglutaminase domain-containing protein [Polyangiaceae bacterium]
MADPRAPSLPPTRRAQRWEQARRLSRGALALAFALALAPLAGAEGSILHEYIPPDPGEDVSLATTTLDGDLPAAIQTPSGVATAPDPRSPPSTQQQVYSGASSDSSPDSTYEPDRDTRRPNVENYDDPFSPATAPFKRLSAYDEVGPDYGLRVHRRELSPVKVGGSVGQGDEPFYGDIAVDLIPDQPVRIPTVGPAARLLRMHVNPDQPVTILSDGADNWFVKGTTRARVRLVVELAIQRATFGSEFADVDWGVLSAHRPAPYAGHDAAFEEVARAIGVSRAMRPRDALRKMVEYFRSFAPSDDPPRARDDIYLDLALSKKGVCRHRSFAFLVTALHLGIPARMVVNEAHAWVEVFDATLWHRIDLGGAALNMEQDIDPGRPPYVPPPDPYAWPESRDSGQDLADRSRAEQQAQSPGQGNAGSPGAASSSSPAISASAGAPLAPPPPSSSAPSSQIDPAGAQTEVTVSAIDKDIRRGLPLHLQGHVSGDGGPCGHVRVDVILASDALPQGIVVGSLSTDDRGRYDGAVIVPRDFAVGDYDLVVGTPGDPRCNAGRTGPAAR